MIKKKFMAVAVLGAMATCGAQPLAMPGQKVCKMILPTVEPLDNFQGPVSGPFLLEEMPQDTNAVTLLSMNIQGLPDFIAKSKNPDYREDRYDCLGKLAGYFDMVAFQENFMRRVPIETARPTAYTKFDIVSTGRLNATYNSGLSINGRIEFKKKKEQPYSECKGLLSNASDCWAMKGYQEVEVKGINIVNTHLDAGGVADQAVRGAQLKELSQGLPKTGPLVVMGDLNLKRSRAEDEKNYIRFLKDNGLQEVARSGEGLDVIAVRDVKVNWVSTIGNDLLSDHKGLMASLTPSQR